MSETDIVKSAIDKVSIQETAMGVDEYPSRRDVRWYILKNQYEVRRSGSFGAQLLVYDDDGYQILASVMYDSAQ